jgi:hypothetical protein
MLVDDGIRPFDLEVIAKELPVVRVVVDDQEAQGTSARETGLLEA